MDGLLQALLLPEPLSKRAWDQWRDSVQVEALPYACQALLPALKSQLSGWLADDPAAGLFQGIVRMAWSQNQLRLRKAMETIGLLERGGIRRPVIAGPLLWSCLAKPPAVRVIPHLSVLVAREDVEKAVAALVRAGWRAHSDPPPKDSLDFWNRVSLGDPSGCHAPDLHLHWRLIETRPQDAHECEKAFLSGLVTVEWNRQSLPAVSPEAAWIHALCGDREKDVLPWQADVALMDPSAVNWLMFRKLALRYAPQALDRLAELRGQTQLSLPEIPGDNSSPFRRKLNLTWDEYRTTNYHRQTTPSRMGFLRFLADRWNIGSVWQVPFAGARRAFRYRRELWP